MRDISDHENEFYFRVVDASLEQAEKGNAHEAVAFLCQAIGDVNRTRPSSRRGDTVSLIFSALNKARAERNAEERRDRAARRAA